MDSPLSEIEPPSYESISPFDEVSLMKRDIFSMEQKLCSLQTKSSSYPKLSVPVAKVSKHLQVLKGVIWKLEKHPPPNSDSDNETGSEVSEKSRSPLPSGSDSDNESDDDSDSSRPRKRKCETPQQKRKRKKKRNGKEKTDSAEGFEEKYAKMENDALVLEKQQEENLIELEVKGDMEDMRKQRWGKWAMPFTRFPTKA